MINGTSPPPCPPWCISDHPAEDTITPTIAHRPHLSLPMSLRVPREFDTRWNYTPKGPEVVTLVTRDDVLVTPDPASPGQWGMGTPQVRIRISGSWLIMRSGSEVAAVSLLLDEMQDWQREQLERLNDAAMLAWPEWTTNEAHAAMQRRLRREGAL